MSVISSIKPGNVALNEFSDQQDLIAAMADHVVTLLRTSIVEDGIASLAVSGGRSPIPLFQALSNVELPWDKVTVTLVDERWVPNDHEDSNEKLVKDYLLKNNARAACFIPMKNSAFTAEDGQIHLEELYRSTLRKKFSVVVLGMGEDGHTASFFPEAKTLSLALDMSSRRACQAIVPPEASHHRMTLTLPRLLASKEVILQISGNNKRKIYDAAMGLSDPDYAVPVSYIVHQDFAPVTVYWAP